MITSTTKGAQKKLSRTPHYPPPPSREGRKKSFIFFVMGISPLVFRGLFPLKLVSRLPVLACVKSSTTPQGLLVPTYHHFQRHRYTIRLYLSLKVVSFFYSRSLGKAWLNECMPVIPSGWGRAGNVCGSTSFGDYILETA